MSARRVKVARGDPTPRDGRVKEPTFTGSIRLECRVLSNPVSFLHIGSGAILIKASRKELAKAMEKRRDLGFLVKELKRRPDLFEYDYLGFTRYGGRLVIPGTTIKGMCRSRLELLTVAVDDEVQSCFRQASPPPRAEPRLGSHGWRHFRIWSPTTWEDRGPACDATKTKVVCLICDVFGAPGLSSRVYFGNFVEEEVSTCSLTLDHGEKIEAVEPGSVFMGEISFCYLKPFELGLVLAGLGATKDGAFMPILLGKSKYRVRKVIESSSERWKGKIVRFGNVIFSAKEIKLIKQPNMPKLPSGWIKERGLIIFRGDALKELISQLVKEASTKIPGLKLGFSELKSLAELEGGTHYG